MRKIYLSISLISAFSLLRQKLVNLEIFSFLGIVSDGTHDGRDARGVHVDRETPEMIGQNDRDDDDDAVSALSG